MKTTLQHNNTDDTKLINKHTDLGFDIYGVKRKTTKATQKNIHKGKPELISRSLTTYGSGIKFKQQAYKYRSIGSVFMKPYHIILTACLAAMPVGTVFADTTSQVAFDRTMSSEILGKDVEYTVYLPPNFSEKRKYPVVYLMHGGGDGDNSDWYLYGHADTTFDALINSGEVSPFIAVTPDGRRDDILEYNTYYMNDADGGYRWEDMFIQEFVPFVEETYPAISNEGARAIMGLSMGGYAALAYALKYPDMFAASAGLSPAIRTDQQIADLDQAGYDRRYGKAWGLGLEGEARLNDAYYSNSVFHLLETLPADDLAATEFFIDTGSDDVFFEGSVLMHNMLRAPQADDERAFSSSHRFMIREGAHNWTYWREGLPEATRFVMGVIEK